MDRVFLIGLLALALTINALILLVVLRRHVGGRRDHPVSASAYGGPLPEIPRSLPQPTASRGTLGEPDHTAIAQGPPPDVPTQSWSRAVTEVWTSRLQSESARSATFSRSTAIVAFRLGDLDELEAGTPVATHDDVRAAIVGELEAAARSIDVVQADGAGTFRCLLVETDDHGAQQFAEQVIRDLRPRLADASSNLRLVAGWASAAGEADLELAERLAHARMAGAAAGWIRSGAVATT